MRTMMRVRTVVNHRQLLLLIAAILTVTAAGCTGSSTAPSSPPSGTTTIAFSSITADGAPVTIYTENGYSLSTSGDWQGKTTFGNPPPFIEFVTPAATMKVAMVQVFANTHEPFTFRSVDVYSSITTVPYVISGVRDFSVVFMVSDTLPNTFGNFRTVLSTHPNDAVDTLTIQLTNPVTCCANTIGIDNIVVSR